MPNANYSNEQYVGVISRAIRDFDSIFDELANKSVVDTSGAALRADTTGVRTDVYPTLIRNQLYRVAGVTAVGTITAPSGVIANYSGATRTVNTTPTISYNTDSATINIGLVSPGYYDSTSTISMTATAESVNVSGAIDANGSNPTYVAGANDSLGYYSVTPSANAVLKEVTIAEGDIDVSIPTAGVSTAITNDVAVALGSGGITGSATLTTPAAADLENYVAINLSATSSVDSVITVAPTLTFTAGYISTAPTLSTTAYPTISETPVVENKTIYLPKGSATATVTGGGLTISDDQTQNIIASQSNDPTADAPANTYEIKVEAASATINGSTTEGWVETGSNVNLGTITGSTQRLFVNKGNVADNSVTVNLEVASSGSVNVASTDSDAHTITISRLHTESGASTGTVTPGYTTATSYTTTTTVNDLELKIAKGAAAVTDTLTSVSYDGTIGSTTAPLSGDYYTIVPKVNVTTSVDASNSKEGYLIPSSTTVTGAGLTNASGTPLYIEKGAVTLTHGLTTTTGSGAILQSSAPASGTEGTDYYKVTTSGTVSVTPGYVTSNEITEGEAVSYYIPKAVFQYVSDSTAGNIIQVSSAGFVPSGTIAVSEGSLDMATVLTSLSDTGSVLTTSATGLVNPYTVSITKDATTGAGYISGTNGEGTVALSDTYYIPHGAFASTPSVTVSTSTTPTYDSTNEEFTFATTATAVNNNTTSTFREGYIKSADVTLNSITPTVTDLVLPEAELSVSTGTAQLGGTASSNIATVQSSVFYVTPTLTSATVKATVATSGYAKADQTESEQIAIDATTTATPVYIKAGTSTSFTNSTPVGLTSSNFTNPFSSNSVPSTDPYTISLQNVSVTVTDTLDPGYYGANHSITTTRGVSGSIDVAHGHVTIAPTAANVSFNDAIFGTGNISTLINDPASYYYALTATAGSITLSRSNSTTGYVNTSNDADWTLGTNLSGNNSSTIYVKKYQYNGDKIVSGAIQAVGTTSYSSGNETVTAYLPQFGSLESFPDNESVSDGIIDDVILHTANTYIDKNIYIPLSANAAGSNVVADLTRLNSRLNGELVRAGA